MRDDACANRPRGREKGILMLRTLSVLFILLATTLSVSAQSETDLKNYFQGKSVTVRIDMPATSDGVNVYPERSQSLDYNEYNQRLARNGASIQRGHTATVSKVRVKGNHIEVQLTQQEHYGRFNVHFARIESWMLTAAGLIDALNRYVEFTAADKAAARLKKSSAVVRNGVVQLGPRTTYLEVGLKTSQVLKLLGEPSTFSERDVDGRKVATYEFQRGEGRVVIAEFVGGALIGSRTEIRTGGAVALVK
jgi:hypothetical protein